LREASSPRSEQVIDFTRYDLSAQEPRELTRSWSLMGQINQKRTRPQDRPLPWRELPLEDRKQIVRRYPELASGV